MRFCDLFIKYKIEYRKIAKGISFEKLPRNRKVVIVILPFLLAAGLIFFAIANIISTSSKYGDSSCVFNFLALIMGILLILFIVVAIILDQKNMENLLNKYYVPYSQRRMDCVINILKEYGVDIRNIKEIDLLIDEAKLAQLENDYCALFEKQIKATAIVVTPIIIYVADKIGDYLVIDDLLVYALLMIIFIIAAYILLITLYNTFKDLFLRKDYKMYAYFISDMRQIKLFYREATGA